MLINIIAFPLKHKFHVKKKIVNASYKQKYKEFISIRNHTKQGLIATPLSVLEALVFKVDENIHPWTST